MTYWIIGGTSGIGAAIADKFEHLGIPTHRTGEECDVALPIAIIHEINKIGRDNLQGVVFSAGVNRLNWLGGRGEDKSTPAKRHMDNTIVLDTNLQGFISLLDILSNEGGHLKPLKVLAISSDAATRPMRTSMAYCASKAGLDMAVKVAARELGPHGWRVNAIAPGMTAPTGMSEYIDQRVPELRGWTAGQAREYEEQQAVIAGRVHPEEIADVALSVIFSASTHLNGAIVPVNGGR